MSGPHLKTSAARTIRSARSVSSRSSQKTGWPASATTSCTRPATTRGSAPRPCRPSHAGSLIHDERRSSGRLSDGAPGQDVLRQLSGADASDAIRRRSFGRWTSAQSGDGVPEGDRRVHDLLPTLRSVRLRSGIPVGIAAVRLRMSGSRLVYRCSPMLDGPASDPCPGPPPPASPVARSRSWPVRTLVSIRERARSSAVLARSPRVPRPSAARLRRSGTRLDT